MPRDPPFCIPNQSVRPEIKGRSLALHAIRPRRYAPGAVQLTIIDVGPRDGLQNEATTLSPAVRAELCDRLAAAGVPRVEAVSFVHPKLVPQMAGAEEVMAAIERRPGTVYAGLVLNDRGYERALAAGIDEVHYAFPVTDEFAQRNQNTTVAAAVETAAGIVGRAREDGVRVTVTLSVAFGCPFEGAVDPGHVLDVAARVAEARPDEINLADTIGVGVPSQVDQLVRGTVALGVPVGCQRGRGDRRRLRRPRRLDRRHRRVPVRAARDGQHRDRGPRLPLARHGPRDRDRPRGAHRARRVAERAARH
jgi:hypothetical protein